MLDTLPPRASHRRLLSSADAGRRLDAALEWLGRRKRDGLAAEACLLLAPTRGAAEDLLRDSGLGLLGVHRLTLPQLAADLATRRLAEQRKVPVRGLALEALAARAIAETHHLRPLEYFAPVAEAPGLPGSLARTLGELRSCNAQSESLTALGARGRDLCRLLKAFEHQLDAHGLVDPPGLLKIAYESMGSDHPLVGLPVLWLDLTPESPRELDLLRALADHSPEVLATAVAEDRITLQNLEQILDTSVEALDTPARAEPVDAAENPSAEPSPSSARLRRLRSHIFRQDPAHADTDSEADEGRSEGKNDNDLVFLSAPGEDRECVEIARRLLAAARDGLAFDQCAVALRQPDTYIPLIEEAFHRARIPVHFTRGTRRPDPAGRAFLALLACADEQLSASRFAEYLSLGQLPDADPLGAPPSFEEVPWVVPEGDQMVFKSSFFEDTSSPSSSLSTPIDPDAPVVSGALKAPRRWERLLVDAAVIRGRDRWRRRLAGVIEEHKLQLRSLSQTDERDRRRLAEELDSLRSLQRFALPLIEDLDELPDAAPWGEWLTRLDPLAARALKTPDRVLEVLSELRPMAEVGPVRLQEVRRVLAERLSLLRTEPTRRRFGRVLVATIDELRGRRFHTVFLPGLAEGLFPRRALEDPLLLDQDRRRLGLGLITQEQRFAKERRLLRIAIGAADRRLITSYPSLDTIQGRSRVPSFYALDILRAAEGRFPDLQSLERRAAAGSSLRLGWPAPKDPKTAIDDAEFDLATLTGLMEQRPEGNVGRGRYLLDTNAHLRRCLRNRYSRWAHKWSPADGLISSNDETLRILHSHRPTERSYSPTSLQHFAACPYRFYLHGVLRLRLRDRIEQLEQMDPLTRGALFHQVQFELLSLLKDRRLLPMQGRQGEPDYLDTLYHLTDQTLEAVAKRYEEDLAPAIPRVWRSEIEGLQLDLRGWVRSLVSSADSEPWVPSKFELAFGLAKDENHDPESSEEDVVIAGGRRIRGSIDLVEVDPAHKTLRITDHKTGRPRSTKGRRLYVGGGELLQPVLYSLAAEAVLDQQVESGRLSYCTRRGGYRVLEAHLDDEARDAVDVFFQALERQVEKGFLPAAPREQACRWCDYRLICGPQEELRSALKAQEPLAELRHVRSLP